MTTFQRITEPFMTLDVLPDAAEAFPNWKFRVVVLLALNVNCMQTAIGIVISATVPIVTAPVVAAATAETMRFWTASAVVIP